jgi:type III pantothenate kinase
LKAVTHKGIRNVIACTVKDYPAEWKTYLKKNFNFIELTDKTPVPVKNKYATPNTLGKDRLASAVAASSIFPGRNVLTINAGTCITYDFIDSKGVYHGGSISPGIEMRFKALHTFTGRLPLVEVEEKISALVGKTTKQSILSGVQQGILKEIEGIIQEYKKSFNNLQILVTGGSSVWLKKHLAAKINIEPFLTLKGLNVILAFSHTQQKQ